MNTVASVVVAVRDGGPGLERSLRSVLDQEGVDFELIVVDDGSKDETPAVLARLARGDARMRVLRQPRAGQTRALVRGCEHAVGEFVARHDAGDLSLPGRLKAEVETFFQAPDASLVSCGTRFVGPAGEILYEVRQAPAEATSALRATRARELRGPSHHGATMFRRSLYEAVGGYRPDFPLAQDIDLWVRLAERGAHRVVERVLYEAAVTVGSVSQRARREQQQATRLILRSARARREGRSDAPILRKASRLVLPEAGGRTVRARGNYFIARCLQARGDGRSREYFRRAVAACPWHVKSAVGWLLG